MHRGCAAQEPCHEAAPGSPVRAGRREVSAADHQVSRRAAATSTTATTATTNAADALLGSTCLLAQRQVLRARFGAQALQRSAIEDHARTTKLVLAVTHEAAAQIKALIANVRAGPDHIRSAAPQLDKTRRWPALLPYIVNQMPAHQGPRGSPPTAAPAR